MFKLNFHCFQQTAFHADFALRFGLRVVGEHRPGILPDYAYEGLNAMGIEVPMPIQASWPVVSPMGDVGNSRQYAYSINVIVLL